MSKQYVWVKEKNKEWEKALVVRMRGSMIDVHDCNLPVKDLTTRSLSFNSVHMHDPDTDKGVEDMVNLNYLHEPAVLHNLHTRFTQRHPYTLTGRICVAMNPYKWLPLYTDEIKAAYKNGYDSGSPHVYMVADETYRAMMRTCKAQSILISGESGSGKTETTKIAMKYLSYLSRVATMDAKDDKILKMVLQSNPLLEAFGNAKTLLNDNSSRFGKWVQIQFNSFGQIVGAHSITYLLEKSRVVFQSKGERSYHIFYQLLAGATSEMREELGLGSRQASDFNYLKRSDCFRVPDLDDARMFEETKHALEIMQCSTSEMAMIWQSIACVLLLGQTKITAEKANDYAVITVTDDFVKICSFLEVKESHLSEALCMKHDKVRGELVTQHLTVQKARDTCNALAKALYARLFEWLIRKINTSTSNESKCWSSIGILDIFGFECFEQNSFEQFCINFANEKLQQQFNADTFKHVKDEYESEGLSLEHVEFVDNQLCLDLLEGKQNSVISMLDEESKLSGDDLRLLERLYKTCRSNGEFIKPMQKHPMFGVKHYAGPVFYQIANFIEKNRDPLSKDVLRVLAETESELLRVIMVEEREEYEAMMGQTENFDATGRRLPKKQAGSQQTVATQFKVQLQQLMDSVRATDVFYVRCIRPNTVKSAEVFDLQHVLNQLRYSGLVAAIQISRASYPAKMVIEDFVGHFHKLVPASLLDSDPRVGVKQILKKVSIASDDLKSAQIGVTRVYLGEGVLGRLETALSQYRKEAAMVIQRVFRARDDRQMFFNRRNAALKINSHVRTTFDRRTFLKAREAAIRIESMFRRKQARASVSGVRLDTAVFLLQGKYRSRTLVRELSAKRGAATTLQANARAHAQRSLFLTDIEEFRRRKDLAYQVQQLEAKLERERQEHNEEMEAAAKRKQEEADEAEKRRLDAELEELIVTDETPKPTQPLARGLGIDEDQLKLILDSKLSEIKIHFESEFERRHKQMEEQMEEERKALMMERLSFRAMTQNTMGSPKSSNLSVKETPPSPKVESAPASPGSPNPNKKWSVKGAVVRRMKSFSAVSSPLRRRNTTTPASLEDPMSFFEEPSEGDLRKQILYCSVGRIKGYFDALSLYRHPLQRMAEEDVIKLDNVAKALLKSDQIHKFPVRTLAVRDIGDLHYMVATNYAFMVVTMTKFPRAVAMSFLEVLRTKLESTHVTVMKECGVDNSLQCTDVVRAVLDEFIDPMASSFQSMNPSDSALSEAEALRSILGPSLVAKGFAANLLSGGFHLDHLLAEVVSSGRLPDPWFNRIGVFDPDERLEMVQRFGNYIQASSGTGAELCGICGIVAQGSIGIRTQGRVFHRLCFQCGACQQTFSSGRIVMRGNTAFHPECLSPPDQPHPATHNTRAMAQSFSVSPTVRKPIPIYHRNSMPSNVVRSRVGGVGAERVKSMNLSDLQASPELDIASAIQRARSQSMAFSQSPTPTPPASRSLSTAYNPPRPRQPGETSVKDVMNGAQDRSNTCGKCKEKIRGRAVLFHGQKWHDACFVCALCRRGLTDGYKYVNEKPYCAQCIKAVRKSLREAVNPPSNPLIEDE